MKSMTLISAAQRLAGLSVYTLAVARQCVIDASVRDVSVVFLHTAPQRSCAGAAKTNKTKQSTATRSARALLVIGQLCTGRFTNIQLVLVGGTNH